MSRVPKPINSFVVIGDSFNEGVGDETSAGDVLGWADRAAHLIANRQNKRVRYANLAIRGYSLGRILEEQLQPAIDLEPEMLVITGGGNDLMVPKADINQLVQLVVGATKTIQRYGITPVVITPPNLQHILPAGTYISGKGQEYISALRAALSDVLYVNNWEDERLAQPDNWGEDRLHLNERGHARVAQNFATALGFTVPDTADAVEPSTQAHGKPSTAYYWDYVLPWLGRWSAGTTLGDGMSPKFAGTYRLIDPETTLNRPNE